MYTTDSNVVFYTSGLILNVLAGHNDCDYFEWKLFEKSKRLNQTRDT